VVVEPSSNLVIKTLSERGRKREMVNCNVCDAVLDIEEDELDEGDEFTCDECGAELVVVSKDPLEIEPLSEDEEDEDEDEEDLDEDEDEDLDEEDEEDEWK
jgi:alpha-aminoadipate carrier protein LysW